MKFTVRGVNLTVTPSLERYATAKLTKPFERLWGRSVEYEAITVGIELKHVTAHHRKGLVWRAAASVRLPQKSFFAAVDADELHAAIDLLEEELDRELSKIKERLRSRFLRGARRARELLRFHRLARFLWRGRRREEGI
jgi:ribosomal subunit interface protein